MLNALVFALIASTPPAGMVRIPAGTYAPLYGAPVHVEAFALDQLPVTRAESQQPMVGVTWVEAKQYCEARGKRLPTTAEWERAASATSVNEQMSLYATRAAATSAGSVGHGERNRFGVFDMHGLVWEWTLDFRGTAHHEHHEHHEHHAEHTGASCASAAIGATNVNNYPAFLRNAVRSGLERTSSTSSLGFRCAADL